MALKSSSTTVTSAGTAVQLSTTSTLVSSIIIRAMEDNSGAVYIGDSTVSSSTGKIEPRTSISFSGDQNTGTLNLNAIYVDSGTSSDGVDFWYTEV